MKLLGFDTSTEACTVALLSGEHVFSRTVKAPRDHAKLLLPMIEGLLKEAGLALAELDALAFGGGPGSFTGVRIACSMAQGLSLGAQLPLIQVSSLQILAQTAMRLHKTECVLALFDARMGEVYAQTFSREKGRALPLDESVVKPFDQLSIQSSAFLAGTIDLPSVTFLLPDAQDLLELAKEQCRLGAFVETNQITPLYLRNNVVS